MFNYRPIEEPYRDEMPLRRRSDAIIYVSLEFCGAIRTISSEYGVPGIELSYGDIIFGRKLGAVFPRYSLRVLGTLWINA